MELHHQKYGSHSDMYSLEALSAELVDFFLDADLSKYTAELVVYGNNGYQEEIIEVCLTNV